MSGLDGQGWPTEPIDEDEIMNQSDTPRTDHLENSPMFRSRPQDPVCGEAILHARKLERELTAARQEIERLDVAGIHSCHDQCQRPICILRRELDAARAEADKWERIYDQDTDHLTFMQLRDNYGAIETLDETAKRICAELKAARAELADWHNAAEQVKADHPDEVHCGCVAILRKQLNDVTEQRDDYRKEIEIINCRLKGQVHPDDNGIMSDGEIDIRKITEQRDRLAEALKKCIGWTYRAMDLEVSGSMLEAASIDVKEATKALQSLTANEKCPSVGATE
jgi:hypothetical protein